MSSGIVEVTRPSNEYPDIVGARPDEPGGGSFRPYIPPDVELPELTARAVLTGTLLGILMMIPLRRALIVQQHGILKYPEGTACAEVLKAGASDESRAASRGAG